MSFQFEPKVTLRGTKLPMLNLKGKPYLQVAHRLVWFREESPDGTIDTEIISVTDSSAVITAKVYDNTGRLLASGTKKETADNFPDFIEKAETGAIGRALAVAGYGTQFEPEFDEAERLADAPISIPERTKVNARQQSTKDNKTDVGGAEGSSDVVNGANTDSSEVVSREQLNADISTAAGILRARKIADLNQLKGFLKETYAVTKKEELNKEQAALFLGYLNNLIGERK